MAFACDFCKKGPVSGNKVSHSNIKTRTRWLPNIRKMKALVGGTTRTVRACTRCIRSGKVTRPPVRTWKPEAAAKVS
jgi:large subunit ribosomal protein L28